MRCPIFIIALCACWATAAPSPAALDPLDLVDGPITSESQLQAAIDGIKKDFGQGAQLAETFLAVLNQIVPADAPASVPEALAKIATAFEAHPTDFFAYAADLVLQGIVDPDLDQILSGYAIFSNQNNVNLRDPTTTIYPKAAENDAPYDISEAELRSKIYIPATFTYGQKLPVILVPGTGAEAGYNFAPNFGKLLAESDFADPVYLNVPDSMLDDVQDNAEYVAYATNYISGISGNKNVSILGWSQGTIAIRWAHKYWPSTREVTSANINISPDYYGTVLAYLICPGFPEVPCPPSVIQQERNSTFIATLRNNGGDSAYVPSTAAFSLFDEVVQPQTDTTASGYSLDARNVGVTNIYLQDYCGSLLPGGTIYNTHEGVLYNALAVTAALEALKNGGAADMASIDVAAECQRLVAEGLGLPDVLATASTIPIAALNILGYANKVLEEPRIKDYARADIPAGYNG